MSDGFIGNVFHVAIFYIIHGVVCALCYRKDKKTSVFNFSIGTAVAGFVVLVLLIIAIILEVLFYG
jgi:hypothetical protein